MDMIQSTGAPAAIGPYSQAVDTGSTVYLSGQIGQDPASGQIVTGFKAQTIQALENLKAVLAAAGMTLDNMAQVDVFVTDMRNFEDFNAIYSTYFPAYKPARLFVEVRGLCPGAEVEIRGIAPPPGGHGRAAWTLALFWLIKILFNLRNPMQDIPCPVWIIFAISASSPISTTASPPLPTASLS